VLVAGLGRNMLAAAAAAVQQITSSEQVGLILRPVTNNSLVIYQLSPAKFYNR